MSDGSGISRRTLLLGGAAVLAGAAFAGSRLRRPAPPRIPLPISGAGPGSGSGRAPNVLLILTDQERARHLYPETLPLPQRDRLMERSTIFEGAHATTNLCSMARGSVYTGLHAQNNGVWENVPLPFASDLRRDVPTLGHLFQDAGYTTGYFGKWHLTSIPHHEVIGVPAMRKILQSYGFEHNEQDRELDGALYGHRFDPLTADATLRFLEARRGESKPWFAAVNFVNPHDIMFFSTRPEQGESRIMQFPDVLQPEPEDPLYAEDLGFDLPEHFGPATLEGKPEAQREYQRVMELVLGEIPNDRPDLWRRYQNYYFNCLRDVDRQLGRVLDGLDQSGQAERTIVLFAADHGEMAGVHGLREKGGVMYRESSNVPLWIRHPDVPGGTSTQALASHVDIAPTLLALAGVEREALRERHPALPGVDLSSALGGSAEKGPAAGGRESLLFQWTSSTQLSTGIATAFGQLREGSGAERLAALRALREEPWFQQRAHMRGIYDGQTKFARYFSPRDHHRPESYDELAARNDLELYDTRSDPAETRNLAGESGERDRVETMNRALLSLVDREIGVDDGSYLPGPASFWQGDSA